jgi:hypothetical protein
VRNPVLLTSCVLAAAVLAGCGSNGEAGGQPSSTPSPSPSATAPQSSDPKGKAAVGTPVVAVEKNWTGQCRLLTAKDIGESGFGAVRAEPQDMGMKSCGTDGTAAESLVLFGELPSSTGRDIAAGPAVHPYQLSGNTAFWACGKPTMCYHYVVLDRKRWLGLGVAGTRPQAELEKIARVLMQRLWSRIPNA